MEKQCRGTGGGIQLLDSTAELTGAAFTALANSQALLQGLGCSITPSLGKGTFNSPLQLQPHLPANVSE